MLKNVTIRLVVAILILTFIGSLAVLATTAFTQQQFPSISIIDSGALVLQSEGRTIGMEAFGLQKSDDAFNLISSVSIFGRTQSANLRLDASFRPTNYTLHAGERTVRANIDAATAKVIIETPSRRMEESFRVGENLVMFDRNVTSQVIALFERIKGRSAREIRMVALNPQIRQTFPLIINRLEQETSLETEGARLQANTIRLTFQVGDNPVVWFVFSSGGRVIGFLQQAGENNTPELLGFRRDLFPGGFEVKELPGNEQ